MVVFGISNIKTSTQSNKEDSVVLESDLRRTQVVPLVSSSVLMEQLFR